MIKVVVVALSLMNLDIWNGNTCLKILLAKALNDLLWTGIQTGAGL